MFDHLISAPILVANLHIYGSLSYLDCLKNVRYPPAANIFTLLYLNNTYEN